MNVPNTMGAGVREVAPHSSLDHPLAGATTFQLGLVADTLLAERQLLQLHASLASHMASAGNQTQTWLEHRIGEIDAQIVDILRMATNRDHDEDSRDYLELMTGKVRHIMEESSSLPDIGKLIKAHRDARGAQQSIVDEGGTFSPEAESAADQALEAAERALFRFRPATADQASIWSNYLLGATAHDFLDVSLWGEDDIRLVVGSMVGASA
jgi:hypothetical protein